MSEVTPQEISAAAHDGLPHANPLTAEQMDALARHALADRPTSALEIGCGPGTFALALARQADVRVLALDTNPHFLARARRAAKQTTLRGSVTFEPRAAATYEAPSLDLVVCIGASQALGTPREALARVAALTRPGGRVLFAELAWAAPPPAEFMAFLGVPEDLYWNEADAAELFAGYGLAIDARVSASRDAWDAYESAVRAGRRRLAATLPPEEAAALLARAEGWFAMYEAHGRSCLGFTAWSAVRDGAASAA